MCAGRKWCEQAGILVSRDNVLCSRRKCRVQRGSFVYREEVLCEERMFLIYGDLFCLGRK